MYALLVYMTYTIYYVLIRIATKVLVGNDDEQNISCNNNNNI